MHVKHGGADRLGERHQVVEAGSAARDIFSHQHRILGGEKTIRHGTKRRRIRRHRHRHFAVRRFGQCNIAGERLLRRSTYRSGPGSVIIAA